MAVTANPFQAVDQFVHNWLVRYEKGRILQYYELGEYVNGQKELGPNKKYAMRLVTRVSAKLGWNQPSRLYPIMKLAAVFTKEELLILLKRNERESHMLGWSHIRALTFAPMKKRNELINKFYELKWTAAQLSAAVKLAAGDRKCNNKAGRPLLQPTTLAELINQQQKFVDDWFKREDSAWSENDRLIASALLGEKKNKLTADQQVELDILVDCLDGLAKNIKKLKNKYEKLL